MKRAVFAFLAGLAAWIVLISLLNRALRLGLPGYAAAEPAMSFTLGMLAARLAIGALASVIAGCIAAWLAPASLRLPVWLGIALLVAFVPIHVRLWSSFPVWYHLLFLGTILPLVILGARRAPRPRMAEARAL